MNNSVKALIVISFNEGRQGLLERHVTLGWGGLQCCERGGGSGGIRGSPKEGTFFETEK